jgi:hypothetical protein
MVGLRTEGKEGGVAQDGAKGGAQDGGGGGNDDDESSGGGRGAAALVAASRVGTAGGVWKAPVTAPANGGQVLPGDMRIGDEKVATSMWFRER